MLTVPASTSAFVLVLAADTVVSWTPTDVTKTFGTEWCVPEKAKDTHCSLIEAVTPDIPKA